MSKFERRKDATQEAVESTAIRVGRITTIITTAVADVAREIGDAISDGLEMRQAAKRAAADEARGAAPAPSAPAPSVTKPEQAAPEVTKPEVTKPEVTKPIDDA